MKSRDGKSTYYRHHRGGWHVRFHCVEGRVQNKICGTKTDRDALRAAIRRIDDLDFWFPEKSGENPVAQTGTFGSLAEIWLLHSQKVREISESCMINYRGHLKNHILPIIGSRCLKDLTIRGIEEVAAVLKDKRPQTKSYRAVRKSRASEGIFEDSEFLSPSYRRELLTVACMVTKHGFERGYILSNPFAEFKLPSLPEQPYDFWRLEEEDAFLQWLEDGGYFDKEVGKPFSNKNGSGERFKKRFKTRGIEELYDVVLFALRSGLRKGEIGALTPRDVNFSRNCIVVSRAYSEREKLVKNTTKGQTFRIIEMNADMRTILEKRVARSKKEDDLLFNTRTWAVKNFSKYCRKAGVREIHFHSLRHTCLTNLANGYGMDAPLPLPQVQKIAGHRQVSTTMRYVHTDGIENTGSRQWSRDQRKAEGQGKLRAETPVRTLGHLRIIG